LAEKIREFEENGLRREDGITAQLK